MCCIVIHFQNSLQLQYNVHGHFLVHFPMCFFLNYHISNVLAVIDMCPCNLFSVYITHCRLVGDLSCWMIVDQCSLFAVVMCVLLIVDVPLCLIKLFYKSLLKEKTATNSVFKLYPSFIFSMHVPLAFDVTLCSFIITQLITCEFFAVILFFNGFLIIFFKRPMKIYLIWIFNLLEFKLVLQRFAIILPVWCSLTKMI